MAQFAINPGGRFFHQVDAHLHELQCTYYLFDCYYLELLESGREQNTAYVFVLFDSLCPINNLSVI